MKTTFFAIVLFGGALALVAADTDKASPAASKTELSATKTSQPSSSPTQTATAANEQASQDAQRVSPESMLTKTEPAKAAGFAAMFNPFAPVKPEPKTRWLERTSWTAASTAAAGSSVPGELRHEAQFGVVVASR